MDMEYTPTAEDVRARSRWVAAFIAHPQVIEGIYINMDVDSIVFRYTTTAPAEKVWSQVAAQAAGTGWKLQSRSPQQHVFVRTNGAVAGTEEARVTFARGTVVVGWIQVDHLHTGEACDSRSEDGFARRTLWPRYEAAAEQALLGKRGGN